MAGNNRIIYGDLEPIPEPAPRKPVATVLEPLNGYWSQDNNWGTTKNLKAGYPIVPDTVAILQNTKLPGPPRARSIFLERSDLQLNTEIAGGAGSGTGSNFIPRARIRFGVGGAVREIIADWNTSQFNLIASTVQVDAVFEALVTTLAYTNVIRTGGTPIAPVRSVLWGGDLSVFVGSDPTPFHGDNTYTQYLNTVALANSSGVAVPPGAVAFSLSYALGATLAGADSYVVYYNTPGDITLASNYARSLGNQLISDIAALGYQTRLALPGGCKSIRLFTGTAASMGPFFITWYLGF